MVKINKPQKMICLAQIEKDADSMCTNGQCWKGEMCGMLIRLVVSGDHDILMEDGISRLANARQRSISKWE